MRSISQVAPFIPHLHTPLSDQRYNMAKRVHLISTGHQLVRFKVTAASFLYLSIEWILIYCDEKRLALIHWGLLHGWRHPWAFRLFPFVSRRPLLVASILRSLVSLLCLRLASNGSRERTMKRDLRSRRKSCFFSTLYSDWKEFKACRTKVIGFHRTVGWNIEAIECM